MERFKLGEMEQRFAELIWNHEPVSSRTLTELCAEAFDWKRTTTYTMLRRLCDRGYFKIKTVRYLHCCPRAISKPAGESNFSRRLSVAPYPNLLPLLPAATSLAKRKFTKYND